MQNSKAGWKRKDIDSLLQGFGFIIDSGSKHDKAWHPDYPQLLTFLPRHRQIAIYVVNNALKLVDRLDDLKKESNHEQK